MKGKKMLLHYSILLMFCQYYYGGRPETRTLKGVNPANFQDWVLIQPDTFLMVSMDGIEPTNTGLKTPRLNHLATCSNWWTSRESNSNFQRARLMY